MSAVVVRAAVDERRKAPAVAVSLLLVLIFDKVNCVISCTQVLTLRDLYALHPTLQKAVCTAVALGTSPVLGVRSN